MRPFLVIFAALLVGCAGKVIITSPDGTRTEFSEKAYVAQLQIKARQERVQALLALQERLLLQRTISPVSYPMNGDRYLQAGMVPVATGNDAAVADAFSRAMISRELASQMQAADGGGRGYFDLQIANRQMWTEIARAGIYQLPWLATLAWGSREESGDHYEFGDNAFNGVSNSGNAIASGGGPELAGGSLAGEQRRGQIFNFGRGTSQLQFQSGVQGIAEKQTLAKDSPNSNPQLDDSGDGSGNEAGIFP